MAIDVSSPAFVEGFDEAPLWSARFAALLFRHLVPRREVDILDVATGTGFPALELASLFGPSCRVVGVDPWASAIARAERKRAAWAIENARFVEADAVSLPFSAASFDLVVSNLGVNNFADPARVLTECARVARPGARLVLTTNPFGTFREVYATLEVVLRARGDTAALARLATEEAHRSTPAALAALVEASGFRVTQTFDDHFTFRFASGRALLTHHLVRVGFVDAWRGALEPATADDMLDALAVALDHGATADGVVEATIPMSYLEAERR